MRQPSAPKINRVNECKVEAGSANFTIQRNEMLLKAALEQGIDYPHNCRVGVCGQCKTRLRSGRVSHMVDLALSPLTNDEIKNGYFLACQGKVRGDIEIDVNIGQHNIIPEQVVSGAVSSWRVLPGEVIDLRVALNTPFQFHAGQYCTLAESGSFVRRCYSFYDHPPKPTSDGTTELGFLIKRLPGGEFSEWLFAQDRTGVKMWVHGPYGLMGVDDSDRDALCIAGGTGLAPILSILADRLAKTKTAHYTLVYGVKNQWELFAMDKLQDLIEDSHGRLRVLPVLSHEEENSSWQGERGLVTDMLDQSLGVDFSEVNVFVCGSLPMVEAVESRLQILGVPQARIHADKFMPTG